MKQSHSATVLSGALAAVIALGGIAAAPEPARADGGAVAAAAILGGVAGFALGAAFPFNAGYAYSPTGYWYVNDPAHYRYPTAYYRWYAPAGGYVYVGPNWRYWYQNRQVVYAPTPYFVTPPRGYVYYPPIPYGYGPNLQPAGGYR